MDTVANPYIVKVLRDFFTSKGFEEVFPQSMTRILAACEDPATVTSYEIGGRVLPLPQTNQINLEYRLLEVGPEHPGWICLTISYRGEPNPTPGRHDLVFPIFEFEAPGMMDDLRKLEAELLEYLGFSRPVVVLYEQACRYFNVEEIGEKEEQSLCEMHQGPVSLEFFPPSTHPFWNMAVDPDGLARKIDVLLGMEVIGSAEREIDPCVMRERFFAISNGEYARLLFHEFGEKEVRRELEEYLALPMFPRYGGGIGLSRLERVMTKEGLL